MFHNVLFFWSESNNVVFEKNISVICWARTEQGISPQYLYISWMLFWCCFLCLCVCVCVWNHHRIIIISNKKKYISMLKLFLSCFAQWFHYIQNGVDGVFLHYLPKNNNNNKKHVIFERDFLAEKNNKNSSALKNFICRLDI